MSAKVTTEVTTPRNHIIRRVLSAMLGAGFGPAPLFREGILSPPNTKVSPEQKATKGPAQKVRRTEAHTHLISRYHERYHSPQKLYLVGRWA